MRRYPKVGNIITKAGVGSTPNILPIYTLVFGSPIIPAGIEGIRKTTDTLDTIPFIEDLSAPDSLPDHVGIAVRIEQLNQPDAKRFLVLLDGRSIILHDIWVGMRFSILDQIIVNESSAEDARKQNFLIPFMVF